jgi:hypothetical protein
MARRPGLPEERFFDLSSFESYAGANKLVETQV